MSCFTHSRTSVRGGPAQLVPLRNGLNSLHGVPYVPREARVLAVPSELLETVLDLARGGVEIVALGAV
eukprot:3008114-Lingulodinium_polyedra.AAC.1